MNHTKARRFLSQPPLHWPGTGGQPKAGHGHNSTQRYQTGLVEVGRLNFLTHPFAQCPVQFLVLAETLARLGVGRSGLSWHCARGWPCIEHPSRVPQRALLLTHKLEAGGCLMLQAQELRDRAFSQGAHMRYLGFGVFSHPLPK